MKNIFWLALFLLMGSCIQKKTMNLKFYGEFIVEDSLKLGDDLIGGLSGMDYLNDTLFFVVDDPVKPRILKGKLEGVEGNKVNVNFLETVYLIDSTSTFFNKHFLDLESIFVHEKTGRIHLTSEGSINNSKEPILFSINRFGMHPKKIELPKYLTDDKNHFHNKSFESSCLAYSKKGFWFATEEPLRRDGELTDFNKTNSPLRFSFYDFEEEGVTKQFAYSLGKIDLKPNGNVKINGVTALLEYEENKFLVVERAYVSGYGSYGNVVKIFNAEIDKSTSEVSGIEGLLGQEFTPMKKELILNLNDIKDNLTDGIVDNIEGITFGPKLPNGNRMLILVADDNFQKFGRQLNQFIYFEQILN
jgi:hypothetical protein